LAFLIDTNVAIHLRDRDLVVAAKVAQLEAPILLSVISRVELEGGVYSDRAKATVRRQRLDVMLESITVLPFDDSTAHAYGRIVDVTGFSRRKIIDRIIAAQALVHRATLVSLNGDDFRDVPGLQLLEWRLAA
jgi:predicted nucleic acid-binding protein